MTDEQGTGAPGMLPRFVAINEEIKRVVQGARQVNNAALNAMLLAKKSGSRAAGFGVVAAELRRFSTMLESHMQVLSNRIFSVIERFAALQRRSRLLGLLRRAGESSAGAGARALDARLAHGRTALAQTRDALRRDLARFGRELDRSRVLCEHGARLVTLAKVESVYGGDFAARLRQVSRHFETAIECIVALLDAVRPRLAGCA